MLKKYSLIINLHILWIFCAFLASLHREGYRDALALHAESQFSDEENSENQSDTEEECPWAFSEKSKHIPTSAIAGNTNNGDYNRVCFFLKGSSNSNSCSL